MEKMLDQDWEILKLEERELAVALERHAIAYKKMAIKYQIQPERGDKYDVRTNEIIRNR